MKKTPLLVILGLSGAGLHSGLAARRTAQGPGVVLPTSAPLETETSSGAKASGTAVFKPEKASPIPVPPPTSTDAVDTLLEEDRKHARTMLDARSEVRAFMTNEE